MGEAKRRREMSLKEVAQAIGVETMKGRIQVKWDSSSSATPFGQMAFFIEFLKLTGLYERWIEDCPLRYAGPNGSPTADILGTWFLSILSGHRRYAHITTLRADGVLPELLGMNRIVSEDTVRRGLKAIEDEPGHAWCEKHLDASVWPLLSAPWIMDIDVTVKPLFGHQECAEIGYNPTKPGRPSHTYHSFIMAGLRLVLDINVEAGNKSQANTTLPGLVELLDRMPADKRPRCVRGDCGFGQDATMRPGGSQDSVPLQTQADQEREALSGADFLERRVGKRRTGLGRTRRTHQTHWLARRAPHHRAAPPAYW
jgi:hypothetical protein